MDIAVNDDLARSAGEQRPKAALHPEWLALLDTELQKPYMQKLRSFLQAEKLSGKAIFPPNQDIFAAFNLTPFSQVKVVVLGQDPYHGEQQAHGLSFSVKPGVRVPPSLQNIYKELQYDLGLRPPEHGYLEAWSRQGVLLLNAVLTVEKGQPGSHQNCGWEEFTDKAVELLSERRKHLVFLLWGAYAQKKGAKIDRSQHLVLEAPHPSPFSAHKGFLGSRPFSQTNRYLLERGIEPVNWEL